MNKSLFRLKKPDDIKRIADAGQILADIFARLEELKISGMSTWDLDSYIDRSITAEGCRAAFKTLPSYRFASCISINDEAVHGIPSKKRLITEQDLVKIDIGLIYRGFFVDGCRTCSDNPSVSGAKLVGCARDALDLAIGALSEVPFLEDIGALIENFAFISGFRVIKECSGHGVGYTLHEWPRVFHYNCGRGSTRIQQGLVIAIEPVLTSGDGRTVLADDGWILRTVDGAPCAQFEDTVAVTDEGVKVLTRKA